jgi:RNA polymerase sigma-70 factor (ECF subfamily)
LTARKAIEQQLVGLLPRLRRFAIGLSASVDEGDDLTQAACLRALERYEQWEPGTRLDSWVFRIIHTIWLDRRKSAAVRLVDTNSDALLQKAGPSIIELIEAREELRIAWQAISALPAEQREVLLLVTVEGLSYQEAADVLEIPIGTVMSRLARGRISVAKSIRETP